MLVVISLLLFAMLLMLVLMPTRRTVRLQTQAHDELERFYITKKSHLLAAGVTLQEPHIRALNTGMR